VKTAFRESFDSDLSAVFIAKKFTVTFHEMIAIQRFNRLTFQQITNAHLTRTLRIHVAGAGQRH